MVNGFIKCFQIVLTLEKGRRGEGRGGRGGRSNERRGKAERRSRKEEEERGGRKAHCSPIQRMLKSKPLLTHLFTSWSGRLSNPT